MHPLINDVKQCNLSIAIYIVCIAQLYSTVFSRSSLSLHENRGGNTSRMCLWMFLLEASAGLFCQVCFFVPRVYCECAPVYKIAFYYLANSPHHVQLYQVAHREPNPAGRIYVCVCACVFVYLPFVKVFCSRHFIPPSPSFQQVSSMLDYLRTLWWCECCCTTSARCKERFCVQPIV